MSDSGFVHHLAARVYYEDTDAGGIVYYANYLRFAERGRTEYLRALGYDHHQVMEEHGLLLVVRRVEADYLASARLDDLLDIATEILEVGTASMTMRQVVRRGEVVLFDAKVLLVSISGVGKVARLPPALKDLFAAKVAAKA